MHFIYNLEWVTRWNMKVNAKKIDSSPRTSDVDNR